MSRLHWSAGPVQGCAANEGFQELLTAMERELGSALDWRSTAFWRTRSFNKAWGAFKGGGRKLPPTREDLAKIALFKHRCASFGRLHMCALLLSRIQALLCMLPLDRGHPAVHGDSVH